MDIHSFNSFPKAFSLCLTHLTGKQMIVWTALNGKD